MTKQDWNVYTEIDDVRRALPKDMQILADSAADLYRRKGIEAAQKYLDGEGIHVDLKKAAEEGPQWPLWKW